jgi:hypothetical protein
MNKSANDLCRDTQGMWRRQACVAVGVVGGGAGCRWLSPALPLGILVAAAGVQCSGAGGSAEEEEELLPLVVHHIATGGDGSIDCLSVGSRKIATVSEHKYHAVPWRGTAGDCGGWGHR